jgi:glyoxalase family protein
LVETADARQAEAWDKSPVPAERQIVGLHAVRLWERDQALTAAFLSEVLEFTDFGEVDG